MPDIATMEEQPFFTTINLQISPDPVNPRPTTSLQGQPSYASYHGSTGSTTEEESSTPPGFGPQAATHPSHYSVYSQNRPHSPFLPVQPPARTPARSPFLPVQPPAPQQLRAQRVSTPVMDMLRTMQESISQLATARQMESLQDEVDTVREELRVARYHIRVMKAKLESMGDHIEEIGEQALEMGEFARDVNNTMHVQVMNDRRHAWDVINDLAAKMCRTCRETHGAASNAVVVGTDPSQAWSSHGGDVDTSEEETSTVEDDGVFIGNMDDSDKEDGEALSDWTDEV